MSDLCTLVVAAAASLMVSSGGHAQAPPTPDEAKSVTLQAVALLAAKGVDAARPILHQEGPYRHGEIYVNVIDLEGHWLVYPPYPAGEGRNMVSIKDVDGKPVVQDILRLAREKGEGWIEYRWVNPMTSRIQHKLTYVKRVPDLPAVAYVGVYR